MQVLGENPNGAHDRLAHIKVPRSHDDAVDDCVDFPAEHLVQRLAQARLGNAVPRQDQLSVGALKHWGRAVTKETRISATIPRSPTQHQRRRLQRLSSLFGKVQTLVCFIPVQITRLEDRAQ